MKIDSSWTLFLDRDGVINKRKWGGYIEQVEEFHFLENVPQTIAKLSNFFKHVIVVTNQQGIGKKLMTVEQLESIHQHLNEHVESFGGKIDAIYFAPELKNEDSDRRKPKSGMAFEAQSRYPDIDFSKSIMVGDTDSDLLFGKNLGMLTVKVLSEEETKVNADYEVNNISELIELWNVKSI